MEHQKSFFESLFDLSFSSFVTTKIVRLLYILSIVVISLIALVFVVVGFSFGSTEGLLALIIGAPLYWIFAVVYTRVALEFLIVVFRIAEHVGEIAQIERTGQHGGMPR